MSNDLINEPRLSTQASPTPSNTGACLTIIICYTPSLRNSPQVNHGIDVLDLLSIAPISGMENGNISSPDDIRLAIDQRIAPTDVRPPALPPDRPHFDSATGKLWFGTRVVRVYCPRAKNCLRVLMAFEEEGWPPRIDDPLPGGKNGQRVNNTVGTLNDNLSEIEFYAGGDGESFGWRVKNEQRSN